MLQLFHFKMKRNKVRQKSLSKEYDYKQLLTGMGP